MESAIPLPMEHVTLAILAGGEGLRMGRPKGLLEVNGRAILEHLADRLAWPGPSLLVTAPGRQNPPGWQRFGREVSDPVAGLGPLRGILTALENAQTEQVVVATVDMPQVRSEYLRWLVSQLAGQPSLLGMMCRCLVGGEERIEPFPSAYRVAAATVVREQLAAGRRSVHALAQRSGFALVAAPDQWPQEMWTNLNRPEDVQAYLDGLAEGEH